MVGQPSTPAYVPIPLTILFLSFFWLYDVLSIQILGENTNITGTIPTEIGLLGDTIKSFEVGKLHKRGRVTHPAAGEYAAALNQNTYTHTHVSLMLNVSPTTRLVQVTIGWKVGYQRKFKT